MKDITEILHDVENTQKVHGSARRKVSEILTDKDLIGVEIGVQYGLGTEMWLNQNPSRKIYGVDPYNSGIEEVSAVNGMDDEIYAYAMGKLHQFGNRFVHIKKSSDEALVTIDSMVDFVYVDGAKSKQAIWNDISLWYPKINGGGVIIGHDYGHSSYPHIKTISDRYFGMLPEVDSESGIWWVRKQPSIDTRKVSVVIPFYNTAKYFDEVVRIAVEDDRVDDIVVVDDCSEHDEYEYMSFLASKYPKIKVYKNSENVGELKNRFTAVGKAKNDWVILLDCDNSLTKSYIDSIYMIPTWREDVILCPDYGTNIKVNYREFDGDYIHIKNVKRLMNENMVKLLNTGNYFINRSSYLECASKVLQTPKDQYGDIVFNYQWLKDNGYLFVVKGMEYVHRIRRDSSWKTNFEYMQPLIDKITGEIKCL